MISKRGIDVNLKKIKEITKMPNPQTLKEVHRLMRRLVALSHFVSKLGNKCKQFFQQISNKNTLQWTRECKEAFQEIKKYPLELLTLKCPKPRGNLVLNLATIDTTVSSVLVE